MGILTQHMYKAPVPLRALVPEVAVSPGLEAIVQKCLTKKPEGRYQSMDELVADLEKLDKGLLPDAVHEMMARSGGFNVPADYFRNSRMPPPVPATPASRKQRWPLYAAIGAGAMGAIAVVGIMLAHGGSDAAHAQPAVRPSAVAAAASSPPAVTAPPVAPLATTTAAAPQTHQVLVSVIPPDAAISRDGKDLGGAPVALDLADGTEATLVFTRKGYKTKTVTVGPDAPKLTVTLESAAQPFVPRSGSGPKRPPSGGGGGGSDDSDPFTHH
jgi:serine/threonine-protein kinase